jgi:hypothetical protein
MYPLLATILLTAICMGINLSKGHEKSEEDHLVQQNCGVSDGGRAGDFGTEKTYGGELQSLHGKRH